ncbi:hypothetical protein BH23BAC4_BH23BAC4_07630 [soil metagenome]
MTTLTISLPDREAERLRELAELAGSSPEEYAASAISEIVARKSGEPLELPEAVDRVMEKNQELYRRLS